MKKISFVHCAIAAIGLLVAFNNAIAADLQIKAAEIVGYGIFESARVLRLSGFREKTAAIDTVDGVRFIDFTNDIPGEVGTGFGFQYVINSSPRGSLLEVTNVIRFPGDGLKQPNGRTYTESSEERQIRIGARDFYGYAFDEAWEIVPGEWVFEVWHKDARLIRKTFTVLPAEPEQGE